MSENTEIWYVYFDVNIISVTLLHKFCIKFGVKQKKREGEKQNKKTACFIIVDFESIGGIIGNFGDYGSFLIRGLNT